MFMKAPVFISNQQAAAPAVGSTGVPRHLAGKCCPTAAARSLLFVFGRATPLRGLKGLQSYRHMEMVYKQLGSWRTPISTHRACLWEILKVTGAPETQKGELKANSNDCFSHDTYRTHYFKYLKERIGVLSWMIQLEWVWERRDGAGLSRLDSIPNESLSVAVRPDYKTG